MRILSLLLIILLSSCQTLNTVIKEKNQNKGTTKIYDIKLDDAWNVAKYAFRWGGADAIEEHRDQGYMLTSSGNNFVSSGAVMGAWIEPAGNDRVAVTVITKRRVAIDLFTTLTESKWHKFFEEGRRLTAQGEPLPEIKPDLNISND